MTFTESRPLGVVTGASSGIGRALARQLASHGFDLVIGADDEELSPAADELRDLGADVTPARVDFAKEEDVFEFYGSAVEDGRPVEALLLNVGVGLGDSFVSQDLDEALNLVKVNVVSPVLLSKLAIPAMAERGEGKVMFTSSIASFMPGPFQALYNASKAFVHSFAEALAEELSESGVTVTSLMPGPTDTEFFERAGIEDTKLGSGRKDDPDLVAAQGFEAMMADERRVLAGSVPTKLEGEAMKLMPERLATKVHAKQTEPGSGR